MSSLMQFNGSISKKGVGLQFVNESIKYTCTQCGRAHERIHVAFRKPVGMIGCWVQFRYNGKVHAPDLSVPITIDKFPRDAVALTDEESSKYWHS